jgi:hypothetical protein
MMELLQGIWDSAFALSVGVIAGILACKLGLVDWAMGLIIKK